MTESSIGPGLSLSGHLLSEEIGRGGYSRVFRAEPEGGGEAVAIKIAIRPELVQALRTEGAVLRRLQGPRFVGIKEEHLDADPPYFVLELCKGGDLRALLDRSRLNRLPPEEALRIFEGVLEGVAFAHEEGLVHGDLKPENVLLDEQNEPKIADLGLSRAHRRKLLDDETKVAASEETEAGKVRGTFDYLAPEVRKGGEITPQSDVYALGVLLYEMVVGTRPLGLFKLPGEVLEEIVPPAIDRVIVRALAHEAEDRYPDASVMLAHLASDAPAARKAPASTKRATNELLLGTFLEVFAEQALLTCMFVGLAVHFFFGFCAVGWLYSSGTWQDLLSWYGTLLSVGVTVAIAIISLLYIGRRRERTRLLRYFAARSFSG